MQQSIKRAANIGSSASPSHVIAVEIRPLCELLVRNTDRLCLYTVIAGFHLLEVDPNLLRMRSIIRWRKSNPVCPYDQAPYRSHAPRKSKDLPRQSPAGWFLPSANDPDRAARHHHR